MVHGKTDSSSQEVAYGLICFAACGYTVEGCHRGEYTSMLRLAMHAASTMRALSSLQPLHAANSCECSWGAAWPGPGPMVHGKITDI